MLIAIAVAMFCSVIAVALIFMLSDNEENIETIDNNEVHADLKLVAFEIKDYQMGEVSKNIKGIYKSEASIMNIYENDVVIGYDLTARYSREKLQLDLSKSEEVDIENYKTEVDGVYDIEKSEAEKFISSTLADKAILLRTVEAPNYCEVYTTSGNVITRYILTNTKLVTGIYIKEQLPEITTYFNYAASTVEK